jgi:uncharacterized phage protein (TIGR02218 family)
VSKDGISAGMQAHLQQPATTLAYMVKFTRPDGEVLAVTEHVKPLTLGGVTYQPGLRMQSLVSTVGLEVDNTNFDFVSAEPVVTTPDQLSAVWDGTEVLIQQVNWASLGDGAIAHKRGHLGNIERGMGMVTLEFRDLRQALRTDTSAIFQQNCRARLGDDKCTVDLAPLTFAGVITGVISQRAFQAAALTQDTDYFTEGYVTFYTGANLGKTLKVSAFVLGMVTLDIDPIAVVSEGDEFLITAGCLKRFAEDCVGRFDNGLNYQAEKDKPQVSDVVGDPTR